MTPLLLAALVGLALYAVYIAARTARLESSPAHFIDAGGALPTWAPMFLVPALAVAALGVGNHLLMVSHFGLQAAHLAVGLVLVAMGVLVAWNRLWYASRVAGLTTPGEALGRFYGSVTLRIVMLALAALFALPFSANLLSFAAMTIEQATGGAIPRLAGVWLLALSLAFPAIIGGWRATILVLAMEAVLLLLFFPAAAIFGEIVLEGPGFPAAGLAVGEGVLWDRIPGVIQYSAGLGKEVPPGGIYTTVAISSTAVAMLGIVLNPVALYLGQTTRAGRGLGLTGVWLTAGLAAGILLLAAPLIAARMGGSLESTELVVLAGKLAGSESLAGVGFLLMLLSASLMAVAFFVTGGAILFMREFVSTWLLPGLDAGQQRYGARVALGFAFFFVAMLAAFMPRISAILATLALPMTVQLVPALLGIALFRWISRGAVMAGMIVGMLIVFFTEPPGLILFEGLFVDLPWGRWPLTIHSAAWGLEINLLLVLLASMATQRQADRHERDRFHDAMYGATGLNPGGRGLFWALTLLWVFLAYGPGAVLGNSFFSDPIFTPAQAALGIPSLWVWQILFWLLGVVLVWWLAYRIGLGVTSLDRVKPVLVGQPPVRTPEWLAAGLSRVVARDNKTKAPARLTG